jgi:hypothetical protein
MILHLTAAQAGRITTLWLSLSVIMWALLNAVARFDRYLERQEFWEEMQEYCDGTHQPREEQ